MKQLTILCVLFLSYFGYSQVRDTLIIIDNDLSTIDVKATYIIDRGLITPMSSGYTIRIKINSDIINESIQKRIEYDKVTIGLIYDHDCQLKDFVFIEKSKVESYNLYINSFFKEFKKSYNDNNLGLFINLIRSKKECGMESLS